MTLNQITGSDAHLGLVFSLDQAFYYCILVFNYLAQGRQTPNLPVLVMLSQNTASLPFCQMDRLLRAEVIQ